MKKIGILMLALLLATGVLAGCNNNGTGDGTGEQKTVAIVQLVDNGAFTEMREAFINKMRALGYTEEQLVFEEKNAQGDMSVLNSICAELKNSSYDLIVPIVTPATIAVVNQELTTPVVFISVTNPVDSGIMSSMETPDKNATGTSNIIPVDEIFALAETLTPGLSKIGMLYCSGENNAVLTVEKAKAFFLDNNYTYQEVAVANSSEVSQAAQSLAESGVDAIYVPIDSTVQTAMPQVVEAATAAGIPVYGSDPVMVQSGALACVSVSNTQLGEESALMADQIFQGKAVAEIPAIALTDYRYVVNSATAQALNITVPEEERIIVIGE